MIVVSDTTPLNYLVLIGHEHVLPSLFGRVIAPPAVIGELRHPATPPVVQAWAVNPPTWLEIRRPTAIDPALALDSGETEAISLACELHADALLIDERKGSTIARQKGLFVAGTLGVLEIAAERELISLPDAITALRRTSFRVSQTLLDEALARDAAHARPPQQD
jgi:predicted nucleic acid-binding protein